MKRGKNDYLMRRCFSPSFMGMNRTKNVDFLSIANFKASLLFFTHTLFSISEEMVGEVVITPRQKLADLIRLAELCVDLLRQNEEFYAEVIIFCPKKPLKF